MLYFSLYFGSRTLGTLIAILFPANWDHRKIIVLTSLVMSSFILIVGPFHIFHLRNKPQTVGIGLFFTGLARALILAFSNQEAINEGVQVSLKENAKSCLESLHSWHPSMGGVPSCYRLLGAILVRSLALSQHRTTWELFSFSVQLATSSHQFINGERRGCSK